MKNSGIKTVLTTLGVITTASLGISIYNNRKLAKYSSTIDKVSETAETLESVVTELKSVIPKKEETPAADAAEEIKETGADTGEQTGDA